MAVPAHLSMVTLGVADLQRSIAFYEALGWRRPSAEDGPIAFFLLGNTNIAVFGRNDLADDVGVGAQGIGFRGVTLAINLVSKERVDEVFAEFVAAGASVVKRPVIASWGGYSGYAADPDGHLWEIAYNPFAPQWAAPEPE